MAISAALSGDIGEEWYEALCRTPEEAKAMHNLNQARRVMEQASSMPGMAVHNG